MEYQLNFSQKHSVMLQLKCKYYPYINIHLYLLPGAHSYN